MYAGHRHPCARLVLAFQGQWHDPFWPLVVVQSEGMTTIPLYIAAFIAFIAFREEALARGGSARCDRAPADAGPFFLSLSRYSPRGANPFSATKG